MSKHRSRAKEKRSVKQQFEDEQLDNIVRSAEQKEDDFKADIINRISINKEIKYKNSKQKDLVKSIHANQIVFVKGAAGTGKAQPLEEPILTPQGFVPMGSLNVGDEVISVDGTATKIIGVFPQGVKPIYRVDFSDGTHTECCAEHLWSTQTELDRSARKKKNGIAYPSPRPATVKSTTDIMRTLYGHDGRLNHSIPLCDPVEFSKRNVPIDPYTMGILLGDGCIKYGGVTLSTIDDEILESVQSTLHSGVSLKHKEGCDYALSTGKKSGAHGRNYIRNAIVEYGLNGCGSKDKFIPDDYLYNNVYNRQLLLQGLMDSDGTCDKNGVSSFSSTSIKLANGISTLVRSLGGIACTTTKVPKYRNKNGDVVEGESSYIVTINFYSDEIKPFKLSRKSSRYHAKKHYYRKFISNVTLIGEKEAQCIMVDHPSSLYLTRDFIVTHNTFMALKAALEVLKDNTAGINKIMLTKPIVEAGESIGFLPGGIEEKTDPYMKSFIDNIQELIGKVATRDFIANGIIESVPLPYIRGNTFRRSISILDEAQNTTMIAMKLFLSRIGQGSKMIIIGDSDQSDLMLRGNDQHGLSDAFTRFKGVPGVDFFEFTEDDIVRSDILIALMKCYKK
jgi:phosphate starvation-inducible protein PhoH